MNKNLFIVMAVFLLLSCQTTDIYEKGKGPVSITPNVTGAFERYKLAHAPLYFAVAKDGKGSGASTCPEYYSGCVDDSGNIARDLCNKNAALRGTSCSIFAIGREIVWDGPVNINASTADFIFIFAKDAAGTSSTFTGTGRIAEGGRKIKLRLGKCRGEANLDTKNWILAKCKNNYSASGTFVAGKGTEKYYGFGSSSKGGTIDFKLIVPSITNSLASTSESSRPTSTITAPVDVLRDSSTRRKPLPSRQSDSSLKLEAYDPASICIRSLNPKVDYRGWHTNLNQYYVSEAKRRGYSIADCRGYAGYGGAVPTVITRSVAFEWGGIDQLLVGEIQFKKGDRGGTFSVQMPSRNAERCTGTYTYRTNTDGIWSMACPDSRLASGEFITHGKNGGSSGTGKDTKGNKVKFTVAAERK